MAAAPVSGFFRSLFLYDLSEEIALDKVREILGVGVAGREPGFANRAPEYVRFERPPVVEHITAPSATVHYYDYGVVGVGFEVPFDCSWSELVALCAASVNVPDIEKKAAEVVRAASKRIHAALIKPYDYRLSEDYYIAHILPAGLSAADLIAQHGHQIAQIVRGDAVALSDEERTEVLNSRLSYYPNDLLVVGWTAAVVYDTAEGAAPTIRLLEYPNSQLLEFRHYDHVLTGLLAQVYDAVSSGSGFFGRWRVAREAERLNAIQLDVRELTERVDNSIKFLSDTFSARVYRLAANRIGVPDYRTLVDQKLSTAAELYQFMMDRFHQGRAFVLEVMVVVILIIELVFLFRGRS
jgi:hypothetical protein